MTDLPPSVRYLVSVRSTDDVDRDALMRRAGREILDALGGVEAFEVHIAKVYAFEQLVTDPDLVTFTKERGLDLTCRALGHDFRGDDDDMTCVRCGTRKQVSKGGTTRYTYPEQ